MRNVKLIWTTPDAEKHIAYCARVSSPHQDSPDLNLLKYCYDHKHYSIFEMASMCVEIETTRAISAQLIRHKSFNFQEFSQRYSANIEVLSQVARRQDNKNRQNSIDDLSDEVLDWWKEAEDKIYGLSLATYKEALDKGIAKESARMLLPMATKTKLYMTGSIRSWIHYCEVRCDVSTQLEHRLIALEIKELLKQQCPTIGQFI